MNPLSLQGCRQLTVTLLPVTLPLVQLGLLFLQLLATGVDLRLTVRQLPLGGSPLLGQLAHAVLIVPLTLGQLCPAVRDLRRRVIQLGLCLVQLGVGVAVLLPVVTDLLVQLLLGRGLELVLPTLGQGARIVLYAVLDLGHLGLVGVRAALELVCTSDLQVDLGVGGVLLEGSRWHVQVVIHLARAQVRGAKAPRVHVVGGRDPAHHGEGPRLELVVQGVRAIEDLHGIAQGRASSQVRADHALVGRLWPTTLTQDRAVQVVRIVRAHGPLFTPGSLGRVHIQAGDAHGHLFLAHAGHGVHGPGGHGGRDPVGRDQAVDVGILEAQGGYDAQVPECRPVVEGVCRGAHVGTGHL